MLDVYSDMPRQLAVFGTHFQLLEMGELYELRKAVTDAEVAGKIAEFKRKFDVSPECEPSEIERAAKTSVALDKLIAKHNLGSMAYYYEGTGEYENIVTSVIAGNTLLTGRRIPVAGECEIKNVQAMKIMDLFGAGGAASFGLLRRAGQAQAVDGSRFEPVRINFAGVGSRQPIRLRFRRDFTTKTRSSLGFRD